MKHNVLWEDKSRSECPKLPYSGTPFVTLGSDVRECQFGPDRNIKKKTEILVKQGTCIYVIRNLKAFGIIQTHFLGVHPRVSHLIQDLFG